MGSLALSSLPLDEVHPLDGSVALIATGVVDDDTVEYFERKLELAIGTGSRQLIIDLTVCQLASAGLAALIRLQRRSGNRPVAAFLVTTDMDTLWMLRIVGLTARFPIYATLEAALQSCRSAAPAIAGVTGPTKALPSTPAWSRGGAEVGRHTRCRRQPPNTARGASDRVSAESRYRCRQ